MKQKIKNLYWRLYSRFLRLFLPALVVCCIVGLSCAPALAVAPPGIANNILSFKTSVHTEGDAAIVQGTIPLDQAQTRQQVITSKIVTYSHTFDKSWYHFDRTMDSPKVGSYLKAEIFPLGYFTNKNASNLNKTISLAGLPNGTRFSLDARIGGMYDGFFECDYTYPDTYYEVRITYFDQDGNNVVGYQVGETEYHYDTENGPMIYTSFSIDAPVGAVSFRIEYKTQLRITAMNQDFVVEDGVHSLSFRYIVNKLEYDSSLNDYNNSQIGDKIDRIEDSLNDMTNRPVQPDRPPESDIFEDIESAEQELLGKTESGFNEYAYLIDDFDPLFDSTYGGALLVVAKLVNLILERLPGLSTLVYTSLVLGISAFVLSITAVVASRYKSPKETSSTAISRR